MTDSNLNTILFLGGAPSQVPPIKYALSKGYRVITCDYNPKNPGHRLAHKYYNISTTDKEEVLRIALDESINGVVSYASDPAAPTAAYVAERMNLFTNPYRSVLTLARKDLFRSFLKNNGFITPNFKVCTTLEEAIKLSEDLSFPIFVKPVDSSGSKGVSQINECNALAIAFEEAMNFSRIKKVILEEKIDRIGPQVAGDGFVANGELKFSCLGDENFDQQCNGLVPIGQSFPSSHSSDLLDCAKAEINKLLKILKFKQGALNFDFVFSKGHLPIFLEIGPRNGGCRIPELIKYATQIDLIQHTVESALGVDLSYLHQEPILGCWATYIVHSAEEGIFDKLFVSKDIADLIVEKHIYVKKGQPVSMYNGSDKALGEIILKFISFDSMKKFFECPSRHIRVICSR